MTTEAGLRAQCRRYAGFVVGSSVFDRLRRSMRRASNASRSDRAAAGAIVVGVDGSVKSLAAARWAADEAAGRGLTLRLVYAVDPADGAAAFPTALSRTARQAQTVLDDAAQMVEAALGGVPIETCIVDKAPSQALVDAGDPATMICVGASSVPAPPHPGHHASVITEIVLAANCPVTIVKAASVAKGWVVAEINNEPSAEDVLRTAIEEALMRELPLRLVTGSQGQGDISRLELHERIEHSLRHWRIHHPELDALNVSSEWTLEQYLQRHAGDIALFVAPPRQLHDIGTILHATAARALATLDCPVTLCVNSADVGTPNSIR
ncbi:universal stress protein [soil metagenome]